MRADIKTTPERGDGARAAAGADATGAKLIDGTAIGRLVRDEVAREVARLKTLGVVPGLSVGMVGEEPA